MHNEDKIHSLPTPLCKLCGSNGKNIYKGLQDNLFAASGSWNLDQCPNKECGLMWLNPMPLEEDIYKAYGSYYTHIGNRRKISKIRQLINDRMNQSLKLLLRLTPIYRERKNFNQMYLGDIKPGRLLDVGCGNGHRLATFKDLGWSVEGQDVDPICADIAAKKGFKVHLGPLESIHLPELSYDAVVMSHVIEHVHEPLKLLTECRRLLSPQGILIAVTPNTQSYGHRIFKDYWRGLEPPRHVLLYCKKSLKLLARNTGFENPDTWTTSANAHHFAADSLNIIYEIHNLNPFMKIILNIASKLFLLVARIIYAFNKDSGEECVLMLRKKNSHTCTNE